MNAGWMQQQQQQCAPRLETSRASEDRGGQWQEVVDRVRLCGGLWWVATEHGCGSTVNWGHQ